MLAYPMGGRQKKILAERQAVANLPQHNSVAKSDTPQLRPLRDIVETWRSGCPLSFLEIF